MKLRRCAYVLASFALVTAPLAAQAADSVPRDSVPRDSVALAEAGRVAGRRAADRPTMNDRFALSFLAGASMGVIVPIAIDRKTTGALGVLTGGTAVILLAGDGHGRVPPPPKSASSAERDSAYRAGFENAYRERLGFRRRRAANVGAGVGVATGLSLLVLLVGAASGG